MGKASQDLNLEQSSDEELYVQAEGERRSIIDRLLGNKSEKAKAATAEIERRRILKERQGKK